MSENAPFRCFPSRSRRFREAGTLPCDPAIFRMNSDLVSDSMCILSILAAYPASNNYKGEMEAYLPEVLTAHPKEELMWVPLYE